MMLAVVRDRLPRIIQVRLETNCTPTVITSRAGKGNRTVANKDSFIMNMGIMNMGTANIW